MMKQPAKQNRSQRRKIAHMQDEITRLYELLSEADCRAFAAEDQVKLLTEKLEGMNHVD